MTYEELLAENLRLRARIHELEQENARLKGYGSSLLCEPEPPQYGSGPVRLERDRNTEIQRRLDIFRGLFRGREDVFAQRFVSKAGKAGYQPVCKNRWSDGCVEHKYKCEGCPFREFIPLDETVIRRHLDKDAKETDVIGIYPILEDSMVYFLCADFDDKNCEHGYQDDVLSYVRVCKDWGIPAHIERSRSGKGAHVWVFMLPSSVELADATIKAIDEDYDVVMWEKHGVFAVDTDIMSAFDQVDVLNKAAQIYISARNMGFEPDGMTDAQMQELSEVFGLPK